MPLPQNIGHVYIARMPTPGVYKTYKVGCCRHGRLKQHLKELGQKPERCFYATVSDYFEAKSYLKKILNSSGSSKEGDIYTFHQNLEDNIFSKLNQVESQYPSIIFDSTSDSTYYEPTYKGSSNDSVWLWIVGFFVMLSIGAGMAGTGNNAGSPGSKSAPYSDSHVTSNLGTIRAKAGYNGVNMRDEPDQSSQVLAVLSNGEKVKFLGQEVQGWYLIETKGQKGWIWGEAIEVLP